MRNQSGQSQAGKMGPSWPLGKPIRTQDIDNMVVGFVCLFSNFLWNSIKMDKIPVVKAFLTGYAVAVFLSSTNHLAESIEFYFECLVLWNQLSMSEQYSAVILIERLLRQKVKEGVQFLVVRGLKFYDLGQIKESITCLEKALYFYEKTGSRLNEAWCHCHLGRSLYIACQYERAMEHYQRALGISEISRYEKQNLKGKVYNNIGEVYNALGSYEEARQYYEEAFRINKEIGNEPEQAIYYNNMGVMNHNFLGNLDVALSFHEKALEIRKRLRNKKPEGTSYNNIGGVYEARGDYKKALEYYEKSLELGVQIQDRVVEATNLYFIGKVYMKLGQFQKAIEYLERALQLKSEAGVKKAGVLTDLGYLFMSLGDYGKASLYHEEAIKLCEDLGDLQVMGKCYSNASKLFQNLGEYEKAKSYLKKTIDVDEKTENKVDLASTYNNISTFYISDGQYREARECLEKALEISRETQHIRIEIGALNGMGSLKFSLGKYEQAIEYAEEALKIAKEIGEKLSEGFCYLLLGDVYFAQGHNEKAILYKSKALEMMKETGKKDQSQIDVLYDLGHAYSSQRNFSKARETLLESIKNHQSTRSSLNDETDKISLDAAFEMKIFALWFVDKGVSVKFRLVNVDLETELSKESSATEEPGMDTSSSTLDDIQCEDRSLASLYENDPFAPLEQKLKPNKGSVQKLGIKQIGGKSYRIFSCMFKSYAAFIAPIFDLIDSSEIIISIESGYFLTPFASLKDDNGKYLSETLRVRLIPSLTTLKLIHDSPASYHSQSGALIVGDPAVGPIEINGCVKTLDPLPKAREEAQMVSRLVGVPCLIGEEATKEDVLRRIQEVSLVHIAAHGDEDTGEIALAPNKSVVGVSKKEDFLLTMNDVAQVGIRAKLVVLSCCHSARGKTLKAEGIVGIARAFLGSGARSVLMSLWAVDDGATKAFMNIFYKFLIREKLSASESLHQTMRKMRESALYSDRKYWAPFVLFGDDVTLNF
ncbi:Tetratricopeptide repeat protein 28 [Stylophora pistillata]|uniref:Tetratricopeptide repeat protein 28 n=1 Tax=Stylophora pistillata TaxID=50429 RepID=A0A2B4SKG5_STYPI|nr:Tetratricopeptide repeat protein 28 [Stylophora pistillata]